MKKVGSIILVLFLCVSISSAYAGSLESEILKQVSASNMKPNVKGFVKGVLIPQMNNSVFAEGIRKQNSEGTDLSEINKIDREWKDAEDLLPIQSRKLSNTVAREIKKIISRHNGIIEAFVMDNQGAVVGENSLTSDYWQGDEAKWQNSYNDGAGGLDVGKVKFDRSANAVLQQISLPVLKNGRVIGAVTWGIAVDRVSGGAVEKAENTSDSEVVRKLKKEIAGSSKLTGDLKSFITYVLLKSCSNDVFVKEVNKQNAKGISLSEIKNLDEEWKVAEDMLPVQEQALSSPAAREIKKLIAKYKAIVEAFVMDDQGAVVGENLLTSDYWQGDEAKWQNSFNNGNGGIDIGKVKFDRSANEVLQQISLPIVDGEKVIGAVTFGIAVDRVVAVEAPEKGSDISSKYAKAVDDSGKLNGDMKRFVKTNLLKHCSNEVLAREVEKQNNKAVSLSKIKNIDEEWKNAEDMLSIQEEVLTNTAAREIKKIVAGNKAVVEAFLMDNQGAVVGENNLTSDYWQGDEAKWQNSYNNGDGGIDIGKVKFDRSANAVLQQISIPIVNASGKVVGAITFGIAVDNI